MVYFTTVRALFSGSESLVNTLPVIGLSCGVVAISSDANGASFTSATVIVSVPVIDDPLPSETVYVTTGTAPE